PDEDPPEQGVRPEGLPQDPRELRHGQGARAFVGPRLAHGDRFHGPVEGGPRGVPISRADGGVDESEPAATWLGPWALARTRPRRPQDQVRRSFELTRAWSRTPISARPIFPPSSRSTTATTSVTTAPWCRRRSIADRRVPPVVTTSSTKRTVRPVPVRLLPDHEVRLARDEADDGGDGDRAELHARDPVGPGRVRGHAVPDRPQEVRAGHRLLDVHVVRRRPGRRQRGGPRLDSP